MALKRIYKNSTSDATQPGMVVLNPDGSSIGSGGGGGSSTPTSIGDGLKLVTTAATRETLASSTTSKTVVITAKNSNTGTVVVGGSTVVAASGATRRGTPLSAGDTVVIDIDNLSKIYVDVTVSGEGVTYTYVA